MRTGSKLLRDAPNDRYVADIYATDLVLSNDAQQKTKGLKLARQLTEKYPKTYSPWATIANYYGQRFARHPNKADAEQALEATRNCLLYAPRDPYNNENGAMTTYLQEVIDRYEEWIKTHSK